MYIAVSDDRCTHDAVKKAALTCTCTHSAVEMSAMTKVYSRHSEKVSNGKCTHATVKKSAMRSALAPQ